MRDTDHDIIGSRPRRDETEGLGLFDSARVQAASPPPRRRAPRTAPAAEEPSDRDFAIGRLKELVLAALVERALARRDRIENPGVTADDVLQLCAGHPQSALVGSGQRAWSWVGPWLAQLAKGGALVALEHEGAPVYRRSTRPDSHGNLGRVYVHPLDRRSRKVPDAA